MPARDARVLLLSDCVHNAGPDPRPFAARLPRLDVLLDTSGEHDAGLGRDLARLGHGRMLLAGGYRDIARPWPHCSPVSPTRPPKEEQCPSSPWPPSSRCLSTGRR